MRKVRLLLALKEASFGRASFLIGVLAMTDPVDDLIDRMARDFAPDDPAKQGELKAARRTNPKVMDDFVKAAAEGSNRLRR
jgi:hypothetical protein